MLQYALWVLALLLVVLVCLARWRGVYPHRPLLLLLGVPTFLSIWVVFLPSIWPAVVVVDVLLAVAALADLSTLRGANQLAVERQVGLIASLAQPHKVALTLTNRSPRRWPVWVRDGLPEHTEAEPHEFNVVLPPERRATLDYQLRPLRRGALELHKVHVRLRSGLGLWNRYLQLPCHSRVNVYPDMKQLGEYALLARTNRLSLMGLRRTRRVGQDNEFERLRDYTVDDNYRHIEWRSTARRNKLTVKDFQANQSQRGDVYGRLRPDDDWYHRPSGVSLLDHALNAMLMLSYVALARKDQVGLMCFSNEDAHVCPAQAGAAAK